jgi:hypothetical protein
VSSYKDIADYSMCSPSPFVLSEQGERVQAKLWDETLAILKEAMPGVHLLSGIE